MTDIVIAGRKFSQGELLVGIGAIVALIAGWFLPWISVSCSGPYASICGGASGGSATSYWSGDLMVAAAVAALALLCVRMFAANANIGLPLEDWKIFTILGGVMTVGTLFYWLLGMHGGDSGFGMSVGPGFGLFVGLIASVATLAGGYMKKADPQPETKALNIQVQQAAPPAPMAPPPTAPAPPAPAPPAPAPPAPAPPAEPPAPPAL